MKAISNLWLRTKRSTLDFIRNGSGVAAVEFAFIAPLMLVMFFGVVEVADAIAVNRKVTMVARSLSDLTSRWQASTQPMNVITASDLQNVFTASIGIVTPYSPTPVKATISEIYVGSDSVAKVQWSTAATIGSGATQATLTTSPHPTGQTITTIPNELLVKQSYLILAEVDYQYKSMVGKFIDRNVGITLSDKAYTRPRQFTCIVYNNLPAGSTCPTS